MGTSEGPGQVVRLQTQELGNCVCVCYRIEKDMGRPRRKGEREKGGYNGTVGIQKYKSDFTLEDYDFKVNVHCSLRNNGLM